MSSPDPDERQREKRGWRPPAGYSIAVGLVFVGIIVLAAVNSRDTSVLGADAGKVGSPLAEFAVPDARGELEGDANIAQDDCETSRHPCPESERRTPACRVEGESVIRACDLFDRPLVLSFWFTRGGECEAQQDVFETAYRRFGDRVGFLAINVRDDRDQVRELISERGWTHAVGLDRDGALSNLYRVGGCPTFVYAYPGGIVHATSIGELDSRGLGERVEELIAASERRARTSR